jgi:hypothetical protein
MHRLGCEMRGKDRQPRGAVRVVRDGDLARQEPVIRGGDIDTLQP